MGIYFLTVFGEFPVGFFSIGIYRFTVHKGKLELFIFEGLLEISFQGYRALRRDWEEPRESFYWSAHFSFSSSQVLREVPYDPRLLMLFFGEVGPGCVRSKL